MNILAQPPANAPCSIPSHDPESALSAVSLFFRGTRLPRARSETANWIRPAKLSLFFRRSRLPQARPATPGARFFRASTRGFLRALCYLGALRF